MIDIGFTSVATERRETTTMEAKTQSSRKLAGLNVKSELRPFNKLDSSIDRGEDPLDSDSGLSRRSTIHAMSCTIQVFICILPFAYVLHRNT